MWQAIHTELAPHGFTVLGVALDRQAADIRPYVEAAAPSFPVWLDPDHRTAELFGIINVPSGVWIDGAGVVVQPADVAFANDAFIDFHGIASGPHLDALRAWVTTDRLPFDAATAQSRQRVPTADEQLARAEFALAWWLHQHGYAAAAEAHFARASTLAPFDFTISRGSMPIRGLDPMGADFAPLYQSWRDAGMPYYRTPPGSSD